MRSSTIFRTMSVCVALLLTSRYTASAICVGNVVPTPRTIRASSLMGIFASSPDSAWAAGYLASSHPDGSPHALLDHWNGTSWERAGDFNRINEFEDIGGDSGSDMWVVGYGRGRCEPQAAALHWDGNAWIDVSPPICAVVGSNLSSVAVVGSKDVWTVGVKINEAHFKPIYSELVFHWTGGKRWAEYSMPADPYTGGLTSVRAVAPNDVWAVGDVVYRHSTSFDLINHWNGIRWSHMEFRNPERVGGLIGLGVVSAGDVWAVGSQKVSEMGPIEPLIVHWDGTTWTKIPHAKNDAGASLTSVVAISTNDVWAVGSGLSNGAHAEHWDGNVWTAVPAPSPAALFGLAAIPGTNSVWAVGNSGGQFPDIQSLASLFHC